MKKEFIVAEKYNGKGRGKYGKHEVAFSVIRAIQGGVMEKVRDGKIRHGDLPKHVRRGIRVKTPCKTTGGRSSRFSRW